MVHVRAQARGSLGAAAPGRGVARHALPRSSSPEATPTLGPGPLARPGHTLSLSIYLSEDRRPWCADLKGLGWSERCLAV